MTSRRYALTGRTPGEEDRFFVEALDPALWSPTTTDDWSALWHVGMPAPEVFKAAGRERWINHIPGNQALTIKSSLAQSIAGLTRRLTDSHGPDHPLTQRTRFIPQTFSMPADRERFLAAAAAEPDALWLQKPKNSSRGRGIRLLTDPTTAPDGPEWMVQRYIAHPHLINARKYVLRLYVLISAIEPLRVYLYDQGFAKLASHPYSLDDLTDPFVHQTNPDINAENTGVDDPVVFIELADYRQRLAAEGHDVAALFDRLRDVITLAVMAAREPMRTATLARGTSPQGCYEFLGLDCLIDEAMNPWLLECNLSPSLGVFAAPADGGEVEGTIKRQMVFDLVGLLGLNDPERPRAGPDDPPAALAACADAEYAARGGFSRLYPSPSPTEYWPCFPYPRPADLALAAQADIDPPGLPRPPHLPRRSGRPTLPGLHPWQVDEHLGEDGLALRSHRTGEWLQPNRTGALIWLQASEGMNPSAIAAGLAPGADIEQEVHQTLADWARDGLLRQAGPMDTEG